MKHYLSRISGVRDNIVKLKETCLMGYVIGDPVEFSKLKAKLRSDWRFVRGAFEVFERANFWFEIRFANPIDKRRVRDGRPYHVFNKLLCGYVDLPWVSSFDPFPEPISTVDIWIHIPNLHVEYICFDVLSTIIEMNNLGTVCVNVDVSSLMDKTVIIPNEEEIPQTFKLWLDEFSEGCGYCCELDHEYKECPTRNAKPQSLQINFQNLSVNPTTKPIPDSTSSLDEGGSWTVVTNNKKRKKMPKLNSNPTRNNRLLILAIKPSSN
ncbi:hypothetical protein V2J09_011233 [Rumex salicifolius]